MPQVGWICPRSRAKVGWDHFERECGQAGQLCQHASGRPAFSRFLARFARIKQERDVRHHGLDLTGTGTMRCPRQWFLERMYPWHGDPKLMTAPTRGTALHTVVTGPDGLDPQIWSTEATDPVRHDLRGVLFGVAITALADAWKRDYSEIVDSKFPKDWNVRYRHPVNASPENAVQLNIERLLLDQQPWARAEGYNAATVKLTVMSHDCGSNEGAIEQMAPHMSEQEIAAYHPFDSMLSIADHVALVTQVQQEHAKLQPGDVDGVAKLAASIPLVGEPMFNKKGCDICPVREKCDELVRRYGKPA